MGFQIKNKQLVVTTPFDFNSNRLTNLADPSGSTDAIPFGYATNNFATTSYIESNYLSLSGGTMTGITYQSIGYGNGIYFGSTIDTGMFSPLQDAMVFEVGNEDMLRIENNVINGQHITIPNDVWIRSYNSTGLIPINMIKLDTDNNISFGSTISILDNIILPTDSYVPFTDMDVSSTTPTGTEIGYSLRLNNEQFITVYGQSDGLGGLENELVKFDKDVQFKIYEETLLTGTTEYLNLYDVNYHRSATIKFQVELTGTGSTLYEYGTVDVVYYTGNTSSNIETLNNGVLNISYSVDVSSNLVRLVCDLTSATGDNATIKYYVLKIPI